MTPEYGKLLRTVHALRWFTDEALRRRIGRQFNLGESLNDLRRFIFLAHRGKVRFEDAGQDLARLDLSNPTPPPETEALAA